MPLSTPTTSTLLVILIILLCSRFTYGTSYTISIYETISEGNSYYTKEVIEYSDSGKVGLITLFPEL
jgi:hypothetical protein